MAMATAELVERRRREIADAATATFAEKGYHQAGIADIAERLGIGHGTFYRYFKNKRDILEFVMDEVLRQLGEALASEDPDLAATLDEYRVQTERIGRALFDVFIADPALARLFYVEALGADQELAERWLDTQAAFGKLCERYLANGVRRGFLPADLDLEVTARAINGTIFAGALAAVRMPDPEAERDRWVEGTTRLLFEGVGGR
jgi:AcrR family transcriptional regulator